jgi:predicted Zn-dependent protease
MPIEDDAVQTYVNRVGAAVARNAGAPDTPFYFAVLGNDRIIASWSCPGGIVGVTTGFLRTMENEAELAGVLAHETVHVTGRHPLRTYGKTDFQDPAGALPELIRRLSAVVFEQGIVAPLEHAADAGGMEIAYRTGYDPEAFIRLLERLQTLPEAVRLPGSWFKTHPPLGERINRCETRLAKFRDAAGPALAQDRFADVIRRLP